MEWKLIDIKQETNHPFLNFYTLTYEVKKEDGSHEYQYFMASRHDVEHLIPKTKNLSRPDGVLIPLYYQDPKTNEVSIVLTTQFMRSIPSSSLESSAIKTNISKILRIFPQISFH